MFGKTSSSLLMVERLNKLEEAAFPGQPVSQKSESERLCRLLDAINVVQP